LRYNPPHASPAPKRGRGRKRCLCITCTRNTHLSIFVLQVIRHYRNQGMPKWQGRQHKKSALTNPISGFLQSRNNIFLNISAFPPECPKRTGTFPAMRECPARFWDQEQGSYVTKYETIPEISGNLYGDDKRKGGMWVGDLPTSRANAMPQKFNPHNL